MHKFNPGDTAPETGSYSVMDGQGNRLDSVQVERGQRLPPVQSSEYYYVQD